MAKLNGIIKIEGTVEDLTFYKKDGVNYVRRKGGISKERIGNDPNFIRTRENNSEFSHNGTSTKILRTAMGSLLFKAKDSKVTSRMFQTMSRIKNLDMTSARGQRRVSIGLNSPEGKQLLKGFDFNANAPLNSVLYAPHELDTTTGVLRIANLMTGEQLLFPQGATHATFQSAVLALDFETEESSIAFSNAATLPISMASSTVTLTPSSVPTGTGVQLFLVLISFSQEINGMKYSLRNEDYNVLHILEVL